MLIGQLGIGKSSLLNFLSGRDNFVTSDDVDGCTQIPKEVTFEFEGTQFSVVDTAGTGDPDIPHHKWIDTMADYTNLNKGQPFDFIVIALRAGPRPSTM